MIEIKDLRKEYWIKGQKYVALDRVNLHVNKGEIYGIIGRSGAGKSTLVRCINLLERPSDGSITIDGVNLMELSPEKLRKTRQNMGMIFQHFNLLSSRTAAQNIAFPLEIQGLSKSSIEDRVQELIKLTGLSALAHNYPDQLSGGQKQRVAIARALASNPKILLSDEATSALDPETTKQILNLLRKINRTLGITVILITHEMDVVREICDQVAIIDQGNIAESGKVTNIFIHPKTDIAKSMTEATMKLTLPDEFKANLVTNPYTEENLIPVVKITFIGDSANEPLIVTLHQKFSVTANIIQANIEQIHGETVGISICLLQGKKENWEAALNYINKNNIQFEVIGYARTNA
jgi:D-methionine transport system ATP-binding protein